MNFLNYPYCFGTENTSEKSVIIYIFLFLVKQIFKKFLFADRSLFNRFKRKLLNAASKGKFSWFGQQVNLIQKSLIIACNSLSDISDMSDNRDKLQEEIKVQGEVVRKLKAAKETKEKVS